MTHPQSVAKACNRGDAEITVVIPVRNRRELILRCLESVAAQEGNVTVDVIVVDNGSTDGTAESVRRWCTEKGIDPHAHADNATSIRTLRLIEERKPGACAARNAGLREVHTPWTCFFDSDDEMDPALFSTVRTALRSNPRRADLVVWKSRIVGLDGKSSMKPYSERNLLERQVYNSLLSTQAYMGRTEFFRTTGGWDEDAAVWNDWELGIRIALRSPAITWVPSPLVTIHPQEDSITGLSFSEKAGEWEKTLDLVETKARRSGSWPRISRMICYRRANLAAQYMREGHPELAAPLAKQALQPLGILSRQWLRLLMHFTRFGLRGAYLLWH